MPNFKPKSKKKLRYQKKIILLWIVNILSK